MNLDEQLKALIESGTEEEVRDFVAAHFSEFGPETQKELAVELFSEALSQEVQQREAIIAEKDQAIKLIEEIEREEAQGS
jgi:hypothetical protein